jgi:uncharacterized linocin/CFP29 family protein
MLNFNSIIDAPAQVSQGGLDGLSGLAGGRSIAARLLANNMNPKALRNNDTLTYDAWKQIDAAILKAAQIRLVGVGDLNAMGLSVTIDGLSKTVYQYQDMSDVADASLTMDAVSKTDRDRPEFDTNYLPLPIISKDFSFSVREINASRNGGQPLDTTMAERAARKVAEKAEEILFQGASGYTFGGGTIRGYEDHPDRNTDSVTAAWASASGANILTDTIKMKNASIADRYYAPWGMYVATNIEGNLDENFTTNYPVTIRQRILQVEGISSLKVIDQMTAGGILLVSMQSDVVRMINGLPITTIQWDSDGGMMVHFKVMAIMVPQIRSDQDNRSGVIHFS